VQGKGLNFKGLVRALARLRGEAAVAKVVAATRGGLRELLETGPLVTGSWYPAEWYQDLHAAVEATFGGGPALAMEIGFHATCDDLTAVHRFIGGIVPPSTILKNCHRYMSSYWTGGQIEPHDVGRHGGSVRFSGWRFFNAHIWHDIIGGSRAILEMGGKVGARHTIVSGGIHEDLEVRWAWRPLKAAE